MRPGKQNLITDVAGLAVGNASDSRIKTGVTVLASDKPFTAGVHVMGGAPGTRETDLLAPDKLVQQVDALVLSGGSAFGLDAASGVMDGLLADGRGFEVGSAKVPIVPSAILFDLSNGGEKNWGPNPYSQLGREAYDNRAPDFEIGTVGAGHGATAGSLKGGLGSASLILENGITVGALVAVNSFGEVIDTSGKFFATAFEFGIEFGGRGSAAVFDPAQEPSAAPNKGETTTIAIVATDAVLNQAQATRMATAAHDGFARAIIPSHTPFDGDLIFSAATGEKPLSNEMLDPMKIGHAAAVCVARACAIGVYRARANPTDVVPSWQSKFG